MIVVDWHREVLEVFIQRKEETNLEYKDLGQGNVSNAVNLERTATGM